MRRHQSGPSVSPPAAVIAARSVLSLTVFFMPRTDPSAIATMKPGIGSAPGFGSGLAGSYARSSGLVQTTGSLDSAIRIVFDVPSGNDFVITGCFGPRSHGAPPP